MAALTLFLGGVRSGKSRLAQQCAEQNEGALLYCATAEPLDAEMCARIEAHQQNRGTRWSTIECPIALPEAIHSASGVSAVLVDCLTLWLSNLMLTQSDVAQATTELLDALHKSPVPVVLVSNEVGMGVVPESPLGRSFRDAAGSLNQRVAAACDEVHFVVAGLAVALKSGEGSLRD